MEKRLWLQGPICLPFIKMRTSYHQYYRWYRATFSIRLNLLLRIHVPSVDGSMSLGLTRHKDSAHVKGWRLQTQKLLGRSPHQNCRPATSRGEGLAAKKHIIHVRRRHQDRDAKVDSVRVGLKGVQQSDARCLDFYEALVRNTT